MSSNESEVPKKTLDTTRSTPAAAEAIGPGIEPGVAGPRINPIGDSAIMAPRTVVPVAEKGESVPGELAAITSKTPDNPNMKDTVIPPSQVKRAKPATPFPLAGEISTAATPNTPAPPSPVVVPKSDAASEVLPPQTGNVPLKLEGSCPKCGASEFKAYPPSGPEAVKCQQCGEVLHPTDLKGERHGQLKRHYERHKKVQEAKALPLDSPELEKSEDALARRKMR